MPSRRRPGSTGLKQPDRDHGRCLDLAVAYAAGAAERLACGMCATSCRVDGMFCFAWAVVVLCSMCRRRRRSSSMPRSRCRLSLVRRIMFRS